MSSAGEMMRESLLDARAAASGALRHLGLLRFSGPDATTFLQGQVSNDTRRLGTAPPGHAAPRRDHLAPSDGHAAPRRDHPAATPGTAPLLAALSTPQGRVAALLRLLPHSSGIMAVLPRELVRPTLERLLKFVLRAKVKIEDASEHYAVLGQVGPLRLADGAVLAPAAGRYLEQDGLGISRVGADSNRFWVIAPRAALAQHALAAEPAAAAAPEDAQDIEQQWRLADIRDGLPQIYAATSELFVAQMLNLDLIDGISFTKGCYTGQEIIARTQHLGRIKRRMFRVQLPPGDRRIGEAVRLADGRAGRLIELAPCTAGVEALAVLNVEPGGPAETESSADPAIVAVELPLPYRTA